MGGREEQTESELENQELEIKVSVPGKVILHGEHSVVYGKLAIAASLGLRTEATLRFQHNSIINIDLLAVNLSHSYLLDDVKTYLLDTPLHLEKPPFSLAHPEFISHQQLVNQVNEFVEKHSGSIPLKSDQKQAIVCFFYLLKAILVGSNVKLRPFTLTVRTQQKVGAGSGSSASYAVCLSALLLRYISNKSIDKHELDLISKWAYSVERITHGSPSGVDNTICTYGSMVAFRKDEQIQFLPIKQHLRIILVDTNVQRNTKKMVGEVLKFKQQHETIVESILTTIDHVTQRALIFYKQLEENNHVEDSYMNLNKLIDVNHSLLKSLGVSHPKLDAICEILNESDLHGKLTGAGGGGYVFALVPPTYTHPRLDCVMRKLTSSGFHAIVSDLGGAGVKFH